VPVFCSSTGTRYDSAAQAPRSINRHRSEQNGRKQLSFFHSTGAPQVGHATVRSCAIASQRLQNMRSNSTSPS
jgi:hypothetical protein